MTWHRKRHRFVNEDEILIHPFRIDRTLKYQQIFRANDAMLHPGLEVKLSSGAEGFDRQRLLVSWTPQDKTRAFANFEALVLLLVHLEREISAFADNEIFLHTRMFVHCDDNAAPAGANHALVSVLNTIEQLRELFRFTNPVRERFVPKAACFAAVAVERLARIDRRERAQLMRDDSEAWIRGELRVAQFKHSRHISSSEFEIGCSTLNVRRLLPSASRISVRPKLKPSLRPRPCSAAAT